MPMSLLEWAEVEAEVRLLRETMREKAMREDTFTELEMLGLRFLWEVRFFTNKGRLNVAIVVCEMRLSLVFHRRPSFFSMIR